MKRQSLQAKVDAGQLSEVDREIVVQRFAARLPIQQEKLDYRTRRDAEKAALLIHRQELQADRLRQELDLYADCMAKTTSLVWTVVKTAAGRDFETIKVVNAAVNAALDRQKLAEMLQMVQSSR